MPRLALEGATVHPDGDVDHETTGLSLKRLLARGRVDLDVFAHVLHDAGDDPNRSVEGSANPQPDPGRWLLHLPRVDVSIASGTLT